MVVVPGVLAVNVITKTNYSLPPPREWLHNHVVAFTSHQAASLPKVWSSPGTRSSYHLGLANRFYLFYYCMGLACMGSIYVKHQSKSTSCGTVYRSKFSKYYCKTEVMKHMIFPKINHSTIRSIFLVQEFDARPCGIDKYDFEKWQFWQCK